MSTSIGLARDAKIIVDQALACSTNAVAYGDLLRAYIAAPPGGRDALFLEVAFRLAMRLPDVGVAMPTTDRPCSAAQVDVDGRAELLELARLILGLLQRQMPQARS